MFEKYRTNSKWESKIVESRAMVGEQLNGVSRVIDSLLKEVQIDLEFRPDSWKKRSASAWTARGSLPRRSAPISAAEISR